MSEAATLNAKRQLCPVCRNVSFKIPYSQLVNDGIINRDGTLMNGITLPQLIDNGIASHEPHTENR